MNVQTNAVLIRIIRGQKSSASVFRLPNTNVARLEIDFGEFGFDQIFTTSRQIKVRIADTQRR